MKIRLFFPFQGLAVPDCWRLQSSVCLVTFSKLLFQRYISCPCGHSSPGSVRFYSDRVLTEIFLNAKSILNYTFVCSVLAWYYKPLISSRVLTGWLWQILLPFQCFYGGTEIWSCLLCNFVDIFALLFLFGCSILYLSYNFFKASENIIFIQFFFLLNWNHKFVNSQF